MTKLLRSLAGVATACLLLSVIIPLIGYDDLSAATSDYVVDVGLNLSKKKDPVLLIPPLISHIPIIKSREDLYERLKRNLIKRGWSPTQIFDVELPVMGSNIEKAKIIKRNVDMVLRLTGAKKVDIAAYSSGAVSSRWYIRFLGGADKVSEYVSFSGSHHGTRLSYIPQVNPGTQELVPGSDFLMQLNAPVDRNGRETFGDQIHYFNICSKDDGVHYPWQSQLLNGAYTIIIPTHWYARINHSAYPNRQIVIDLVILALDNNAEGMEKRVREYARDEDLTYSPQETQEILRDYFGR